MKMKFIRFTQEQGIRAFVEEAVKPYEICEIEINESDDGGGTLDFLQKEVEGLICTCFSDHQKGLVGWCNDEGMLRNLPISLHRIVRNEYNQPLFGNVVITGSDDEGGTISLTDEQIESFISDHIVESLDMLISGKAPDGKFKLESVPFEVVMSDSTILPVIKW